MRTFLALLLLVAAGCSTVPVAYIQADRATRTAVEPLLRMTARDHPDLGASIEDLITGWELRLKQAEAGVK